MKMTKVNSGLKGLILGSIQLVKHTVRDEILPCGWEWTLSLRLWYTLTGQQWRTISTWTPHHQRRSAKPWLQPQSRTHSTSRCKPWPVSASKKNIINFPREYNLYIHIIIYFIICPLTFRTLSTISTTRVIFNLFYYHVKSCYWERKKSSNISICKCLVSN